jgi:hypothetical protein
VPDDDLFILVFIGMFAVAAVLGSAALYWHRFTAWLTRHGWLVSARQHPLLGVPGARGSGLDLARLAILLGVLVILFAFSVRGVRRRLAAREA